MVKLIALDLDGTLLTTDKVLSDENEKALVWAASKGIAIVPTTGRFYASLPERLRNLPFLRYMIGVNGALAYDIVEQRQIYQAEMPAETAVAMMEYFDQFPVIYDCYYDNWGWMTASMQAAAGDFVGNDHFVRMIQTFRNPVPDLKAHIAQRNQSVQKVQFFTLDQNVRQELLATLEEKFPRIVATSAVEFNGEINADCANKGQALRHLAAHLGVDIQETMAVGDGLNDMTMVAEAGIGVAMDNAVPQLKAVANHITASNDENGVAKAIYHFCK